MEMLKHYVKNPLMKIVEHVSKDLINTKPKSLGYKSDY